MYQIALAQVQDVIMQYARFGNGEKTLVIIPGISVKEVAGAAPALEKLFQDYTEYTIYLIDRRRQLPKGYTMTRMAADTAKVIQSLGLSDCHVYGASQGGMIAMYLAAQNPELVSRLTVASTSARSNEISKPIFARWKQLATDGNRKELAGCFARTIYGKNTIPAAEPVLLEESKTYTQEELERFIIGCEVFDTVEAPVEDILCPTFVVGAKDDRVFGLGAMEEIASRLKNGRFYAYGEEYGHAVYDEAPDFVTRMLEFLRS